MYCIYRITNLINCKTYIGQHKYKETPYDNYMGSGKLLLQAYKKYGKENFIKEVIVANIKDKETINKLEIKYIEFERKSNGNGCYNIADGGDGGSLGEEWQRKVAEANIRNHKGKPLSNEIRKKIAETLKGNVPWNKGKLGYNKGHSVSEETRNKISDKLKGNQNSKGRPSWSKGKHLSEETRNKISEKLRGMPSSTKGKHWKLVDGKRVWY